jgi:hypothetical protein
MAPVAWFCFTAEHHATQQHCNTIKYSYNKNAYIWQKLARQINLRLPLTQQSHLDNFHSTVIVDLSL